MKHEAAPEFSALWDTLVRTGVAARLADEVTVTPEQYGLPADEITLPAPLRDRDGAPVDALPLIRLEDGADLELGELLGTGGMAEVHGARQVALQREVAVKRLSRPDEETHVDALLREAVITGSLEHPNIVPVHALGRDELGRPVLVMKRIHGTRWSALLDTEPLERHLEILEDVCNALHYAHDRGVVHRDVKPQNVLIGEFGEVALLDWGIAARIGEPPPPVMLGTPGYMAPEMVRVDAVSPRTDVYLLGATLHRILAGENRHTGKTTHAVLLSAWRSPPFDYPPEIPAELADLCNRSTARDPADRPPSALAFREALQTWERHRASEELTRAALGRLEGLRERVAEPGIDAREVREAAGPVRFGLREALARWPENEVARLALRDALELLIRWELEHGTADEAEALLGEVARLGPPGEERHLELVAEVEEAVRRARALVELGRQMDMSVGSGWRVAFVLLIGAVGTGVGALLVVGVRLGLFVLDHPLNIGIAAVGAAMFSLVLFAARTKMLATLANRRTWWMVMVAAWGFVLNRVLGAVLGHPVEQVMTHELLLAAAAAGMLGVAVDLRLLVACALLVLAAGAAALLPAVALEIAILSIASCGAIGVAALWRWMR